MKKYIVIGRVLELPADVVVELDRDQLRRRQHIMVPVEKLPDTWERAVFRAKGPIQFKHDELVVTDHDLGKAQVKEVVPVKEGTDPALAAESVKSASQKQQPAKEEKKKGSFGLGR